MKQIHSLRKTAELGVFLSAIAVILAACGGGGGTSTPPPALPNTPAVSTNAVEKALTDGIYHLWGFGMSMNGVPLVFISKTLSPTSGLWNSAKIFGAASSPETQPRLDDVIPKLNSHSPRITGSAFYWTFPASSVQANLTTPWISGGPGWTFTLNQQDISGQTVISQIKKGDGSLINPTLADASAVFPAGSIAYTATIMPTRATMITGGYLLLVNSEASMYGSGWCSPVAGQTAKLGVQINAAGVVSLYSVATGCSFNGLTAIATGTWVKDTSGSDTVYRITYPPLLTADPAWAPAFVNGYSPTSKTPDLVINPANSTSFNMGWDVPVGSAYTSVQPFFNSAALPALRAAAGI